MKDLRAVVSSLGYRDVETYIQSGNVVFSTDDDADTVTAALEAAMTGDLGVPCQVVVVSRAEMAEVLAADPFPEEDDDRKVHVVFRTGPYGPDDQDSIDQAVTRARAKGSRDEVSVAGSCLYLWTPDGFGRSELAAQLSRRATSGGTARNQAVWSGTARNRGTVRKLVELLELPLPG